jgi:predicted nucleotidyltransferase
MDLKQDLPKIRTLTTECLNARDEILSAWVFGSVSKGQANQLSDIDIAIWVDSKHPNVLNKPLYKLDIINLLMDTLHTNVIDLVIINSAPPLLKHRILTTGLLLFEKNPILQRRFLIKSINEYIDTAPLRKLFSTRPNS